MLAMLRISLDLIEVDRLGVFGPLDRVNRLGCKVGPTSDAGERALRHTAIGRKLWFGTPSAGGSRFVETMLAAIETCRQQNRSAFDFVAEAIEVNFARRKTPSRLPGPRTVARSGHPAPTKVPEEALFFRRGQLRFMTEDRL